MAERSFAKEVEKLRLGVGDEFAGEGILAITKALHGRPVSRFDAVPPPDLAG
mgnify:CR=1 FL=1